MHETVNWVLLYKYIDDLPTEFVELRINENTVSCCMGAVRTWGECEEVSFEDIEKADAAFFQQVSDMEAGGYVVTREWHYDAACFDYQILANEIAASARKAFAAVRAAHPNENITAYALISDDSVMTIGPVANSADAFLAAGNDPDIVWNPAEWLYYEGGEYFDIPYRMLLIRCRHEREQEAMPLLPFRSGVIEACVSALEELDKEGLFGAGKDREGSIVLFQIANSEYLDESVKRLNTPEAYGGFRAWWESWN